MTTLLNLANTLIATQNATQKAKAKLAELQDKEQLALSTLVEECHGLETYIGMNKKNEHIKLAKRKVQGYLGNGKKGSKEIFKVVLSKVM